jgi:hypothetical protein
MPYQTTTLAELQALMAPALGLGRLLTAEEARPRSTKRCATGTS